MNGRTNAVGGSGVEFAAVSFDASSFTIPGSYAYYVGETGFVKKALEHFRSPIYVQKNSLLFFSSEQFDSATGDITLVDGGIGANRYYSLYFVEGDGQITVAI